MTSNRNSIERDHRVREVYEQLLEIEKRLIPTGLHVFGRAAELREKADLLRMVASFDRPEHNARALTTLVAQVIGIDEYDELLRDSSFRQTRELIEGRVSEAVQILCNDVADISPLQAAEWLKNKAGVALQDSLPMFSLLATIARQLDENQEADSLMRALRGEFVEPGPGADIVQNPLILPTGRNTHAINPSNVPAVSAFARSRQAAEALLQRYRQEHGRFPRSVAMVLWGLDNIKTQGEGVAQALWLLGVRPVRDKLNRATEVEVIALEELKRPRIDVVMTVSGIFRDLFTPTMSLLDKAVRSVALLDEPLDLNYVRANVMENLQVGNCDFDDAVTRVFSNAPGNYGTNVNFMVLDSQWKNEETLGDLFVTRKSFAYTRDSRGRSVEGREAAHLMNERLSRVEATYQTLDSFEVGITDIDHYFEYLGGVSKAVETRSKSRPAIYLSDSLSPDAKIRSLTETIRLESRTKTLNPKWYEGMLEHGFRGVAEIENHVTNTFGWSATTDAVDPWIYTEISRTFLLDSAMLQRLRDLNPYSVEGLCQRLIEAHERGFWNPDEEILEHIHEILDGLPAAPGTITVRNQRSEV